MANKIGNPGTFQITSLPVFDAPLPASVGRLLTDSAGEMVRIIDGISIKYAAYIEFLPGGRPRGNHVHKIKTEYLYVLTGRLKATYIDTGSGEIQVREVVAGDLITVYPDCAHVYETIEHAQALEMTAEVYDPSDTHRYEIVKY